MPIGDLLSRREAAELASVPLATVNKAVEQRAIRTDGTQIPITEIAPLAVMHRIGLPLPARVKRRIRDWLADPAPTSHQRELALSSALIVRADEDIATIAERAKRYARLRALYIESDPDVKGGAPVIRGTRLTAEAVAARLAGGDTVEAMADDYPDIDPTAFKVADLFARTHPRRGRPSRPRSAA